MEEKKNKRRNQPYKSLVDLPCCRFFFPSSIYSLLQCSPLEKKNGDSSFSPPSLFFPSLHSYSPEIIGPLARKTRISPLFSLSLFPYLSFLFSWLSPFLLLKTCLFPPPFLFRLLFFLLLFLFKHFFSIKIKNNNKKIIK